MSDSSKIDLTFATTAELVQELGRRHRPCVFLGIPHDKSKGDAVVISLFTDTAFDVMGMAQFLLDRSRVAASAKYSGFAPLYREGQTE